MQIDELRVKLIPELRRQGIRVESFHAISMLDSSFRSTVFSVTIDHKYYVIKLYHIHANFVRDSRNQRRLPHPPNILLASTANHNGLGVDFIITEVPQGASFSSNNLTSLVAQRLGAHLIDQHSIRRTRLVTTASLHRAIDDALPGAIYAAGEKSNIVKEVARLMHEFLSTRGSIMRVVPSLLHNDVWWDNIIVTRDEVYLVDWEWMKIGDYVEDLAYARAMLIHRPTHHHSRKFWQSDPDEAAANRFFKLIVDQYRREFSDATISERLKFYLALTCLRRLSDYAAGIFNFAEARDYWLESLPQFWQHGLGEE